MKSILKICIGAIEVALNRDPPQRSEAIAALDRYLIESRRGHSQVCCETTIYELGLSVRTENFLENEGIKTLGALEGCSEEELLSIQNFGPKCLDEVKTSLRKVRRQLRDAL